MKRVLVAVLAAVVVTGTIAASSPRTAAAAPRITLPADAAMHPWANTEWWYNSGHLVDAAGRAYGVEIVFLKRANLQHYYPDAPYDTLYRADVAITDEAQQRFHSAMTFIWPQISRTVVSTQELDIESDAVTITTLSGYLTYHLQGVMGDGAIDLTLASQRAPLLVAGGLLPWGDGYSFYYSLTHLLASGSLRLGDRTIAVHGLLWMDHQWGSWDLGDVRPVGWNRWQWMGMHLSDGTDLNLAAIDMAKYGVQSGGSVSLPDGRELPLVLGVRITPLSTWRSPTTGVLYPSVWHVRIPSLRLDVYVTPAVRDQELTYAGPTADYLGDDTYWEGDCLLEGTHAGRPVVGTTYTELEGYDTSPL